MSEQPLGKSNAGAMLEDTKNTLLNVNRASQLIPPH